MKTGGLRAAPTPPGVPVMITSPRSRLIATLIVSISAGTLKMSRSVRESLKKLSKTEKIRKLQRQKREWTRRRPEEYPKDPRFVTLGKQRPVRFFARMLA